MHLLGAMGPPGGGRMVISRRLQSRFNLINMCFPQVFLKLTLCPIFLFFYFYVVHTNTPNNTVLSFNVLCVVGKSNQKNIRYNDQSKVTRF